jgi:hypothetical protein
MPVNSGQDIEQFQLQILILYKSRSNEDTSH